MKTQGSPIENNVQSTNQNKTTGNTLNFEAPARPTGNFLEGK
jgi:hypothetical protein